MTFSDNLKKIRKKLKFSQQELADKLEVAQSTVGMWESGKRTPKLDELDRLAKVLRTTVDRLISKKQRDISVLKNEIYIDGEKVDELDTSDVARIIEHINMLKNSKKTSPSSPPSRTGSEAKKILVIDDEKEMCEMLYSFLVPHNYKVFLTFNGQMGLEYFGEIEPDVVLLDLSLPDMEGIDVLKIIRKVSNIPILIITGHPENVVDIHLKDIHIEGYIEKPFSLEQILNTLKHIIGE